MNFTAKCIFGWHVKFWALSIVYLYFSQTYTMLQYFFIVNISNTFPHLCCRFRTEKLFICSFFDFQCNLNTFETLLKWKDLFCTEAFPFCSKFLFVLFNEQHNITFIHPSSSAKIWRGKSYDEDYPRTEKFLLYVQWQINMQVDDEYYGHQI